MKEEDPCPVCRATLFISQYYGDDSDGWLECWRCGYQAAFPEYRI